MRLLDIRSTAVIQMLPTIFALSTMALVSEPSDPARLYELEVTDTIRKGKKADRLREFARKGVEDVLKSAVEENALPAGIERYEISFSEARRTDFTGTVNAVASGGIRFRSKSFECNLCTDGEFLESLKAAMTAVIDESVQAFEEAARKAEEDALAEEAVESEIDHEPVDTSNDPGDKGEMASAQIDTTKPAKWNMWQWSGLGAGVVGVAGLAVGSVLVAKGEKTNVSSESSGEAGLTTTNYRPGGIASLVAGGTLLTAGVVLWIVGHKKESAGQVALRERPLRFVPNAWAGQGQAGVGLVGEF